MFANVPRRDAARVPHVHDRMALHSVAGPAAVLQLLHPFQIDQGLSGFVEGVPNRIPDPGETLGVGHVIAVVIFV